MAGVLVGVLEQVDFGVRVPIFGVISIMGNGLEAPALLVLPTIGQTPDRR